MICEAVPNQTQCPNMCRKKLPRQRKTKQRFSRSFLCSGYKLFSSTQQLWSRNTWGHCSLLLNLSLRLVSEHTEGNVTSKESQRRWSRMCYRHDLICKCFVWAWSLPNHSNKCRTPNFSVLEPKKKGWLWSWNILKTWSSMWNESYEPHKPGLWIGPPRKNPED